MASGIYAISNNVNNKSYIGLTNNLNRRKREHFSKLRKNKHKNKHLQSAWNKYGEENFTFDVLKECEIDDLDNWEKWFISSNNSSNRKYGYNNELGGHHNKIISEETRKKMKENHYDCRGENNPNYGKVRPKSTREKISKTRIERGICKGEKNPFYGKTHSKESRRKISENNMGKTAWNKGKKYYQIRGNKNPNAIYTLWDNQKVHYHKNTMMRNNKDSPKPKKCFILKYEGKDVNIGGFIDFTTPQLIYDMIKGGDSLAI